jgi:hypothetical protein|nr:MAG TPA: hypothetical protein [Caudoviricetes sp.]
MNIDSYDWEKLYKTANNFISLYIPVAKVNTGCKSFYVSPRVQISFMAKGNSKYIKLLDEMKCLRKLRGSNSKNGRIIIAEIIFNSDGTLNLKQEV